MVIQSTQFYFIFNVSGKSKNRYYVWIKFLGKYGKRIRIHIGSLPSLDTNLHQATEVLSFPIK